MPGKKNSLSVAAQRMKSWSLDERGLDDSRVWTSPLAICAYILRVWTQASGVNLLWSGQYISSQS